MPDENKIRETGLIAYVLYGVSIVFGPAIFVGLIFAYLKREEIAGTYVASHFEWLIRTFWITLIVGIAGVILSLVLVGILVLGVVWLWFVYRIVKGFILFNDSQPIPDPKAWI
jgi:uncharacterized membrane protein